MKGSLLFGFFFAAVTLMQCSELETVPVFTPDPINDADKGLPARWADVTLAVIRNSFPGSPTYTSRCLGYIGLTMYECVVHGSSSHSTLASQLSDLDNLPLPEQDETYNWSMVLNAGQAAIIRKLYPHNQIPEVIDELENKTYAQELLITSTEVADRSVQYGQMIADAIYEWSKTDGGHEGYLSNFDPFYEFPTGEGYWTPPVFGQSSSLFPLHPYWGNNRTFLTSNSTLPVPVKATYSKSILSTYYQYFNEVYKKRNSLTEEDKRIAAWWADDPSQTASPPGHSYNLATIIITTSEADLFTAAEAYAKTGIAVADAFINCWKCKYQYHSERPFPYIKGNIDNSYTPFWPEPPFPAFSSGHATQSAAAAIALMSVFDNETAILDNTYATRQPDFENIEYRSRVFYTIWSTAEECAYSRFLGGIHTRMDNEAGTEQGKTIGDHVAALHWKK